MYKISATQMNTFSKVQITYWVAYQFHISSHLRTILYGVVSVFLFRYDIFIKIPHNYPQCPVFLESNSPIIATILSSNFPFRVSIL